MKLRSLLVLSILAASLTLTSCASKKPKTVDSDVDTSMTDDGRNSGMSLELNGDSDSSRAGNLKTVYFDYASAALSTSTRNQLESNAQYLKTNPSLKIQVEGHCDERGSVQYNLALGEKRAKSVRDYLSSQGIAANRVNIISLGKEKPVSFGHEEESWSKNRRANFVVTEK